MGRTPSCCPLAQPWKSRLPRPEEALPAEAQRGAKESPPHCPLSQLQGSGVRSLAQRERAHLGAATNEDTHIPKSLERVGSKNTHLTSSVSPRDKRTPRHNLRPTSSPEGAGSAERPPDAFALSSFHEEFKLPWLYPSSVKSPSGTTPKPY